MRQRPLTRHRVDVGLIFKSWWMGFVADACAFQGHVLSGTKGLFGKLAPRPQRLSHRAATGKNPHAQGRRLVFHGQVIDPRMRANDRLVL